MELPITARDPPIPGRRFAPPKRLVYGGLGLTLSEKAEGLEGSGWLLVGIGAIIIKELWVGVRHPNLISEVSIIRLRTVRHDRHGIPFQKLAWSQGTQHAPRRFRCVTLGGVLALLMCWGGQLWHYW